MKLRTKTKKQQACNKQRQLVKKTMKDQEQDKYKSF
jgi:hypothetical protein